MMEAGVSNGTAKVCTNRCEIVVSNQTAGTQVEIAAPSQDGVTVLVNGVEWGPVAKPEPSERMLRAGRVGSVTGR